MHTASVFVIVCLMCAIAYVVSYTVEFQKHGLPHAHCLVWLSGARSEFSASIIDQAGDDSDSGNDCAGAPDQAR